VAAATTRSTSACCDTSAWTARLPGLDRGQRLCSWSILAAENRPGTFAANASDPAADAGACAGDDRRLTFQFHHAPDSFPKRFEAVEGSV
jgi:hypothetical protein